MFTAEDRTEIAALVVGMIIKKANTKRVDKLIKILGDNHVLSITDKELLKSL